MKKMFLATVRTRTYDHESGPDREATRTIPVYANEQYEVSTLIREALEDTYTTVLEIDVEEPIGSPD